VQRSALRIEDDEADEIRRLQDIGVKHGLVCDLLDLVAKLYHDDPLDDRDQRPIKTLPRQILGRCLNVVRPAPSRSDQLKLLSIARFHDDSV
jgi:hypothetical protein